MVKKKKNPDNKEFLKYLKDLNHDLWKRSTDKDLNLTSKMHIDLVEIQYLIEGLIIQLERN